MELRDSPLYPCISELGPGSMFLLLRLVHQSVFHHCGKMPEVNDFSGGQGFLWLTVSKLSAHGHLTTLLRACGRTEHHSGNMW